jgi:chemotaxis protein MotB
MAAGSNLPPIIVKRNGKRGHGDAHGSTTWKIALADFMTAMFIIFLCLWLINQVTPEQRKGIADYFSPQSVSKQTSGSGGILGGQTITQPGALKVEATSVAPIKPGGPSVPQEGEGTTQVPGYPGATMALRGDRPGGELRGAGSKGAGPGLGGTTTQAQVEQIKQAITGIETLPGVTDKVGNIVAEEVQEGLRIQLVDSDKRELFARGSAQPLAQTRELMKQVAKIIEKVPNKIAIAGYTDGVPFGKNAAYSNWELSADRANASRRLLAEAGIPDERFASVTGKADHDPLIEGDKTAPANRRISITLLREKSPQDVASAAGTPNGVADESTMQVPARPAPGPAPAGRLIPR